MYDNYPGDFAEGFAGSALAIEPKPTKKVLTPDNLDEIINVGAIEDAGGKLLFKEDELKAIFPADTSALELARAALAMTMLSSKLFVVAPEVNQFVGTKSFCISQTRKDAEDAFNGTL